MIARWRAFRFLCRKWPELSRWELWRVSGLTGPDIFESNEPCAVCDGRGCDDPEGCP